MRAYELLPVDADTALQDAPDWVVEKHQTEGLVFYRRPYKLPYSDCIMVDEGFINPVKLPDGTILQEHYKLRDLTLYYAQHGREEYDESDEGYY